MGYPSPLTKRVAAGATVDQDVLLTMGGDDTPQSPTSSECFAVKEWWIQNTSAGVVQCEVTLDGTLWVPAALCVGDATNQGTWSATLAGSKIGVIPGAFSGLRLKQNGATAAGAIVRGRP